MKIKIILLASLIGGCSAVNQMNQSQVTVYDQRKFQASPDTVQVKMMDRQDVPCDFLILGTVKDDVKTIYDSQADALARMKKAARKHGAEFIIDFKTRTVNESADWIPEPATYLTAKMARCK